MNVAEALALPDELLEIALQVTLHDRELVRAETELDEATQKNLRELKRLASH